MAAFEDSKISLNYDHTITYSHTIRVIITSKNNKQIYASANKGYTSWDYEGVNSLIVPIITSGNLEIICEGEKYSFTFNVTKLTKIENFYVAQNGMAISKPPELISLGTMPSTQIVKINDSTFIRDIGVLI